MTTNIIDDVILGAITLFFACIVMTVADICVLVISFVATFLFGNQIYIVSLQTLMFLFSAIVGSFFIIAENFRYLRGKYG